MSKCSGLRRRTRHANAVLHLRCFDSAHASLCPPSLRFVILRCAPLGALEGCGRNARAVALRGSPTKVGSHLRVTVPSLRAQRSNPVFRSAILDCFVAPLLAMTRRHRHAAHSRSKNGGLRSPMWRASTSSSRFNCKDVDGQDQPGHDGRDSPPCASAPRESCRHS